jgi:hypothetical protein
VIRWHKVVTLDKQAMLEYFPYAGTRIRHRINGQILVQDSVISLQDMEEIHDESTTRFQLEPEHAGDQGGYSAQSDGSQRHREQERTSQPQGQSYDPRTG